MSMMPVGGMVPRPTGGAADLVVRSARIRTGDPARPEDGDEWLRLDGAGEALAPAADSENFARPRPELDLVYTVEFQKAACACSWRTVGDSGGMPPATKPFGGISWYSRNWPPRDLPGR